jgi:hypothetical protein
MRTIAITVLAVAALFVVRSAIVAAPQQTTQYPGQMTEARVWIQNRDKGDAVGVTLQDTARDLPPLRVHVVNAQSVPVFDEPLRTRHVLQPWEYQVVPVPAAANAMATLTNLGSQGWEVTGGFNAANGAAMLLLKRPRP